MNKKNLQIIFNKYIDNFEYLNNEENREIYKWKIAQEHQSFDLDTPNFAESLKHLWSVSENLIDNNKQLPFYALTVYAKHEPETVREMFKKLFAAGELDVVSKQRAIREFIKESEVLKEKYFSGGYLYSNDQRSVMMYLFLRYPNSNYAYKAKQAKSFADCIEFYEDWGPMTDFRLDIYYKMCDQLIEEIKQNDALMKTHLSRFEDTDKVLHPDDNLHILAFDIIYCSQYYNLYGGITFNPINSAARKLYFERVAKAKELAEKAETARKDEALLNEAKEYISSCVKKGDHIKYRSLGRTKEGVIDSVEGTSITALFPESKKLSLANAKSNIIFDSKEVTDKLAEYSSVIIREKQIPEILQRAEKELEPYLEYLDE